MCKSHGPGCIIFSGVCNRDNVVCHLVDNAEIINEAASLGTVTSFQEG
jgi:hypothetical protein